MAAEGGERNTKQHPRTVDASDRSAASTAVASRLAGNQRSALSLFPLIFIPVVLAIVPRAPAKYRANLYGGSIFMFGTVSYWVWFSRRE